MPVALPPAHRCSPSFARGITSRKGAFPPESSNLMYGMYKPSCRWGCGCPAQQVVERKGAFFDLCGDVVQRQFTLSKGGARKHEIEHVLFHARISNFGTKAIPVAFAWIRTGWLTRLMSPD